MNGSIKLLLALLVGQLALVGVLSLSSESTREEAAALIELQGDEIQSMTIADAEGNEVSMRLMSSEGTDWALESGLPADSSKISTLLEKLDNLSLGWPVANNSATHERFEVAENNFQRKLTLRGDSEEATVFLGTSPGYGQVHARSDSDAVYAIKLANYEVPASADDWLSKTLLGASGEVSAITWPNGLALSNSAEGWVFRDELANIEGAKRAVSGVANLQVLGVLESAPSAAPSDAQNILVQDADGEYRLSFWPRESNNDHVVLSTRYPGEAFRMANYVAEQLVPEAGDLTPPKVPEVQLPGVIDLDATQEPELSGATP